MGPCTWNCSSVWKIHLGKFWLAVINNLLYLLQLSCSSKLLTSNVLSSWLCKSKRTWGRGKRFSLFLSLRPSHREPLELGQKEGTPVGAHPPGLWLAVVLPGVGLRFIPSTFLSPVHFDKPPQVRRQVLAYLALTAWGSQFDWIPVTWYSLLTNFIQPVSPGSGAWCTEVLGLFWCPCECDKLPLFQFVCEHLRQFHHQSIMAVLWDSEICSTEKHVLRQRKTQKQVLGLPVTHLSKRTASQFTVHSIHEKHVMANSQVMNTFTLAPNGMCIWYLDWIAGRRMLSNKCNF